MVGYCYTENIFDNNPSICKDGKEIGETCRNDNDCKNSVSYCDGECKAWIENLEPCPGGSDSVCRSNACGRLENTSGDYECCATDVSEDI